METSGWTYREEALTPSGIFRLRGIQRLNGSLGRQLLQLGVGQLDEG